MKVLFSFFLLICIPIYSQSDLTSTETIDLLIEADGLKGHFDLNQYHAIYNRILTECSNALQEKQTLYLKHEAMFDLLHSNYLKKYQTNSYLTKLFDEKEFNCVTAVLLYNMLCNDLNLKINLYETPAHVYITVPDHNNEEFNVELTDPVDGFDSKLDNSEYIEYLLDYKLITEEELKEKGEDKVYREFISETHKINSRDLIAIYFANLGAYNLMKDSTEKAFNLYKKSIHFEYDSTRAKSLAFVLISHVENIQKDLNKLNRFLLENIDSIPNDKNYYEQMINSCVIAINNNLERNDFETSDSIFSKLTLVLPSIMVNTEYFARIDIAIKSEKIQNKIIRGEYETAYNIATELYAKNKNNSKLLDIYLQCGSIFMYNLGLKRETDRLIEVADSMFTNAPGIKSVEDNYVLACINAVVNCGLYKTNQYKSKEILFAAYKKLPENEGIKQTIAYLYHEIAMSEIRNREYKKAMETLNTGLKYDPENWELKHEISLTKELLNKR